MHVVPGTNRDETVEVGHESSVAELRVERCGEVSRGDPDAGLREVVAESVDDPIGVGAEVGEPEPEVE